MAFLIHCSTHSCIVVFSFVFEFKVLDVGQACPPPPVLGQRSPVSHHPLALGLYF